MRHGAMVVVHVRLHQGGKLLRPGQVRAQRHQLPAAVDRPEAVLVPSLGLVLPEFGRAGPVVMFPAHGAQTVIRSDAQPLAGRVCSDSLPAFREVEFDRAIQIK